MTDQYLYCGMKLASDWPLPELPPAAARAASDLEIVMGQVPRCLPEEVRRTATFAHNGREALWWLEGIGHFHVATGGRRITVEPAPGADAASLRLMLLYPVLALASVLRGDWMLNAAAVEKNGEVFAFVGPSASGKSTVAALLLKRGFRLVSDGLLRVTRTEDGWFLAQPQAPWLQLWPDALRRLGWDDRGAVPVRPDLALQRLSLPMADTSLPLACIGQLREQRGNDPEDFVPSRRPGRCGFETLLRHTAGNTWHVDLADRRSLFQWGVRLTARIRIEWLDVPWGWDRLDALSEQLAGWCGGTAGESNPC